MSFRAAASSLTSSPRCLRALESCHAESSQNKATSWIKRSRPGDRTNYSTSTGVSGNGVQSLGRLKVPSETNQIIFPTETRKESNVDVMTTEKGSPNTKTERWKTKRVEFNKIIEKLHNSSNKTQKAHILRLLQSAESLPPQTSYSAPLRKKRALYSNLVRIKGGRKAHNTDDMSSRPNKPLSATPQDGTKFSSTPKDEAKPSTPNYVAKVLSTLEKFEEKVVSRESGNYYDETWAGEPWAREVETKVTVDRNFPPHDPPLSCLEEGKIAGNPGTQVRPTLTDVPPVSKHNPVAQLSHGLDRVLFNPGVHWLQDPRSHVYNFTPWLEKIPKVNDFAFERLSGFISSSRDEDLRALATQENKKFAGSTSSLSGMLSHIYFLITDHKEIDCTILSQHFQNEPRTFTPGQRMPAMVMLNYKDGIYAIDSHSPEWDDADRNVLTWMGTLLENFLTKSPEDFNTFMRLESAVPSEDKQEPVLREAYRYAKSDKFVMRSQLDCHDSRLPGTGVFDIKTRACVTVRMDVLNYEENAGYMINRQHGVLQSFEKEYYDLIRSAFLKYSFQVRIGNMDGVLVAYHNTERLFGFQYISLDEMDERLLGATPGIGDKLFNHSVKLLEAVLEEASACFPGQSVLCLFETLNPGKNLDVFVQPEWSGSEDTRPIKQLRVIVTHELDDIQASSEAALLSTNQQWNILYKISSLDASASSTRESYNNVLLRKKRSLVLPASVTLEEAEKYWENLSFSKNAKRGKKLKPDAFVLAREHVERFRRLARQGRVELQQKELLLAGQPKIVYGQGVYNPQQYSAKEESAKQTDGGDSETKAASE